VLNEQQAIIQANALKLTPCTGNLEISLFWEEKILILIRVFQLYATFFVYYYESWPSKTREFGTPYFMAILLSFYIPTENDLYMFMADFDKVVITTIVYVGATILLFILLASLSCPKRLRYRMEFTYVD
jgi:hypothetical protein